LVLSPGRAGLNISIRGGFDRAAARQLTDVAADYVAQGGSLRDLVVDLRRTTGCSTAALERLGDLVHAGVRLRRDERPRSGRRRRAREAVPAGSSA
jgi:hypothetical protein